MQTKTLTVEKMDGAGQGLARIATLSAVDHDGDTYAPGAFSWKGASGQWVPILPAHNRQAVPLGKARVYEDGDAALAELHINMDSAAGKEWHATLAFDLKTGQAVQEWSYGFGVLEDQEETRNGDSVRVLKKLDVHEISPVVRGAGIGSGTLALKSRGSFADQLDALLDELTDAVTRAEDVKALREGQGRALSKARSDQLNELRARIDMLLSKGGDNQAETKAAADLERLYADHVTRAARAHMDR